MAYAWLDGACEVIGSGENGEAGGEVHIGAERVWTSPSRSMRGIAQTMVSRRR